MIPTFDIEAHSWVHPIAVGFYDGHEYHEFIMMREDDDVVWDFLRYIGEHHKGIKLYAHNAAGFDNRFILNSLYKHDQKTRFEGGLTRLVWIEPKISFEDSYLLLCKSLKVLCDAFGVEKKLQWPHEENLNPWEMGARLDAFRMYLMRDCLSLSECLTKFCQELLTHFNIVPSSTMSLTAVKAFDKNFYPVRSIDAHNVYERYIREAVYGARNEVYNRYGERVYMYDTRDMYTSCYNVPVPISKMLWSEPNIDRGTVAEATVKVPIDMFIGPLPFRWRGRLIFPVGTFKGWWDTRELRFAASQGVDMTLHHQLESDEEPILKEFGEYVGKLRRSNPQMSRIWKLFGLRLCGKMGQQRYGTEIRHVTDIEDLTGWKPIDERETYFETSARLEGSKSPYVKPSINMRIRSEARIRHTQQLLEAYKRGKVYYCDTDSVYTDVELPIGDNQGDLQLLDFAERAYFIKCKFYGYIDSVGRTKQRTAGFRDFKLAEHDFQKILRGEELVFTSQSLGSWRDALSKKGLESIEIPKVIHKSLTFENRVSEGLTTRPLRLPKEIPT